MHGSIQVGFAQNLLYQLSGIVIRFAKDEHARVIVDAERLFSRRQGYLDRISLLSVVCFHQRERVLLIGKLERAECRSRGEVSRQFETQLRQLEAQIPKVAKSAPPPWIRVLNKVTETLRQEIKPLKALEREHHRQEARKNVAAQLKLAVENEKGDDDDG